jgi:SAM-dependent methyltransferase
VEKIVATDLYDNPGHEGKPEMLTNPEKFAWCPWNKDRLEVLGMDACDLKFPDQSFDFCFSLSSIEHFGPRENTKTAMREMARVLKPGGVCCIMTELILNGSTHPEYFSPAEFRDVVLDTPGLEVVGGPLDWTISRSLVENPIDLEVDDLMVSPHIVLKHGPVIWTTASVFFRKI